MRFLSTRLETNVAGENWLRCTGHANACAQALAAAPGGALIHPLEADGVVLHHWPPDGPGAVCLIGASDTTEDDVGAAVAGAIHYVGSCAGRQSGAKAVL